MEALAAALLLHTQTALSVPAGPIGCHQDTTHFVSVNSDRKLITTHQHNPCDSVRLTHCDLSTNSELKSSVCLLDLLFSSRLTIQRFFCIEGSGKACCCSAGKVMKQKQSFAQETRQKM